MVATAGALLASPAVVRAQGQTNGVALVIGNSKYQWEASLPNVRRDTADIAKRFQALGLKTELIQDVSRAGLSAALKKFEASSHGADLAAFYFAGHGASWDKETYLVPTDADLSSPEIVRTLPPVTSIGAAMKDASRRLLVFDNCRNSPADGWRQKAALNASIVAAADQVERAQAPGTLTLFSTAPGRIALDGPPGQNSPFAAALLRQLDEPSIDLMALPARLRRDLLLSTECQQVLWDVNTFQQPFVMSGSRIRQAGSAAPSYDAAKEVPLTNAYAFARQSGLILPLGLIAIKNATGGNSKIGAFKFSIKMSVGGSGGQSIEPSLLIVMAEANAGTAEAIVATKEWVSSKGSRWRFVTTKVAADDLEFLNVAETVRVTLHWQNRDKGSSSQRAVDGTGVFKADFTRLDG